MGGASEVGNDRGPPVSLSGQEVKERPVREDVLCLAALLCSGDAAGAGGVEFAEAGVCLRVTLPGSP